MEALGWGKGRGQRDVRRGSIRDSSLELGVLRRSSSQLRGGRGMLAWSCSMLSSHLAVVFFSSRVNGSVMRYTYIAAFAARDR